MTTPSVPHGVFEPTNGAYVKLKKLLTEHFDIIEWTRDQDNTAPVMVSFVDITTGDAFTMHPIDSITDSDPITLLVFTTTGQVRAHGPYRGRTVAKTKAAAIAAADTAVAVTFTAALHPPAEQLPALVGSWHEVHPRIPAEVEFSTSGHGPQIVLCIDWTRRRLLPVGPFPDAGTADLWQPGNLPAGVHTRRLDLTLPAATAGE
ncbi:hypothetical protein GCM10010124_25300 [Pilimelia terevasa]|uniref:Uncharacterized protein n=1 Tax=Pilimelia terevasa TaxID=53372 RepID=A0A8J3BUZ6_9ACTN|nr:hypothetical protein [Pilimelia terevasa]GGK31462.1 hypothetical protein GCM10010124_25300 [Pilimelia terevasa]